MGEKRGRRTGRRTPEAKKRSRAVRPVRPEDGDELDGGGRASGS